MSGDYEHWFLERRRLRPMDYKPWITCNAEWMAEEEAGHPGFSRRLRRAALARLGDDDVQAVRTALSALTVVGIAEDIPTIQDQRLRGGDIAKDCGTAIYAIQHREKA